MLKTLSSTSRVDKSNKPFNRSLLNISFRSPNSQISGLDNSFISFRSRSPKFSVKYMEGAFKGRIQHKAVSTINY